MEVETVIAETPLEDVLADAWTDAEMEAFMEFVMKHGLEDLSKLRKVPQLMSKYADTADCMAKFHSAFDVIPEDLEYHFPYIEPEREEDEKEDEKKDEEGASEGSAAKDEEENEEEAEEADEEEDDDDDESDYSGGKGEKDDEFVPDDESEDDDEDTDSFEVGSDDNVQELLGIEDKLVFDDELEYHPKAYYPESMKRPKILIRAPRRKRLYEIEADAEFARKLAKDEYDAQRRNEVYVSRGSRSSLRLRSAPRKRYDEDDDELDRELKRLEMEDKPLEEPKEKIDRVLAAREVSKTSATHQHQNKIQSHLEELHAHDLELQFYIKPEKTSYLHCEWLNEDRIFERFGDPGVAKTSRFLKLQDSVEEENLALYGGEYFNPDFVTVERVIARQWFHESTGRVQKFLVKWSELPYSEATWETREDLNDEGKIAAFFEFNSPPKPLTEEERMALLQPPPPARVAEWYKESPEFRNNNKLRDYQLNGLNWLIQCYFLRRNCILADEMGLGKTVQSVSYLNFLHKERSIHGPFLVLVPLSTIQHWKREIEEWTDMNVVIYYEPVNGKVNRGIIREHEFYYAGSQRVKFHILVTTYETLLADIEDLLPIVWEQVVVDEGHRLKNKNAKLIRYLQRLTIKRRMLLTGTPIQNNTEELWALLNYIEPSEFFSSEEFLSRFGNLTESSQVEDLQKQIRPYVLRRMKDSVEKSIPLKEETIIDIELTTTQKKYYRAIYERNRDFLYKGVEKSNLPSLMNVEMELRKCCNHPWLIKGVEDRELPDNITNDEYFSATVNASGKMVLLEKLLPKLQSEGHRLLIFSQMKKVLDILEEFVEYLGYKYERLDGTSMGNARQEAIDRFSRPGSDRFVFLLSTRAGGVGLNLTAADTVIIFDSDWNPQQDIQAQARVHRIGQKKAVMIYRLVTRNTYESEMFDRASRKLGLDQAVLTNMQKSKGGMLESDKKDLDRLLKLGAYGLLDDDDTASKKFQESKIEDILAHGTRKVTMKDGGGEKGSLGSINYSKMTFASSGSDVTIDINDPDFWAKVLKNEAKGALSVTELSKQFVDGTTVKTARSRKEFFNKVKDKVKDCIMRKQNGEYPPDIDDLLALLKTIQTSPHFPSDRPLIKAWIKDLQMRGSRRKSTQRGAFDDDEEVSGEDESDFDDQEEDDEEEGAASVITYGLSIKRGQVPKGDLCGDCHLRGRLIYCDGECGQAYHADCVGVPEDDVPPSTETWLCPHCVEESFKCYLCQEESPWGEAEGNVSKCSQNACSLFYHFNCIRNAERVEFLKDSRRFRCPVHHCVVCEKSGSTSMVSCVLCPATFHIGCFPATSTCVRLNSKTILCPSCVPDRTDANDHELMPLLENAMELKLDVRPIRKRGVKKASRPSKKKPKQLSPGLYSLRFLFEKSEVGSFTSIPVGGEVISRSVAVRFEDKVVHSETDVEFVRADSKEQNAKKAKLE